MERIEVLKTYKIFIGGQFPRTESGRYYPLLNKNKKHQANICLSSRKDFRNAVVAARGAFAGWSSKTAFNRSQILYRLAEIVEGRKMQFIEELMQQGATRAQAQKELVLSIDRIIYYAGWCDKYTQVLSTVNPVASSHFNFSIPEPMGIVALIADEKSSLIGLISALIPIVAGGNVCVVLASESKPLCAISLAECIATSDFSAGVVNILTGTAVELHPHFSSHMDVNAVIYCRNNAEERKTIEQNAALNVKRSFYWNKDWLQEQEQNPYYITDLQEIKTTWHPIENIGAGGAKY
ncbi:MAG: aldehyde dehydrogenase family protein [Bacteroidetes bacterium]|nr:aldehyde dehydrogenase family protein [Bacteroidota bacterium]